MSKIEFDQLFLTERFFKKNLNNFHETIDENPNKTSNETSNEISNETNEQHVKELDESVEIKLNSVANLILYIKTNYITIYNKYKLQFIEDDLRKYVKKKHYDSKRELIKIIEDVFVDKELKTFLYYLHFTFGFDKIKTKTSIYAHLIVKICAELENLKEIDNKTIKLKRKIIKTFNRYMINSDVFFLKYEEYKFLLYKIVENPFVCFLKKTINLFKIENIVKILKFQLYNNLFFDYNSYVFDEYLISDADKFINTEALAHNCNILIGMKNNKGSENIEEIHKILKFNNNFKIKNYYYNESLELPTWDVFKTRIENEKLIFNFIPNKKVLNIFKLQFEYCRDESYYFVIKKLLEKHQKEVIIKYNTICLNFTNLNISLLKNENKVRYKLFNLIKNKYNINYNVNFFDNEKLNDIKNIIFN